MSYRLSFLIITGLLSACSLTKPMPTPTIVKYSISEVPTIPAEHHHLDKALLVSSMKSSSGYQSNDMLYMTEPFRLQSFAKNSWNAPPANMLQPLVVESLRNTHYFRVVLSSPSVVNTEYRLDTTLLKLQQEVMGSQSKVRLVIDASLIQARSNNVIASQRFEALVPASSNPQAGVVAANAAAQQVLQQLARFTIETTRSSA